MLPGKAPRESRVEMTELVLPSDANPLGTIFGGRVMQWIDIAAGIAAARHARRPAVTASMDALTFHWPIRVGEVVVLEARVLAAFRTSMEIGVTVHSEAQSTGLRKLCTSAFLTFVALDEQGKPSQVPPIVPETKEEQEAFAEAHQRRALRLGAR
ncbi:MAG: acyl-CoA thioesterase [Deltaproteobacteria bacterium]|nr:acyl-CoA thioesterase [Deltaproteobacteria bacterium]